MELIMTDGIDLAPFHHAANTACGIPTDVIDLTVDTLIHLWAKHPIWGTKVSVDDQNVISIALLWQKQERGRIRFSPDGSLCATIDRHIIEYYREVEVQNPIDKPAVSKVEPITAKFFWANRTDFDDLCARFLFEFNTNLASVFVTDIAEAGGVDIPDTPVNQPLINALAARSEKLAEAAHAQMLAEQPIVYVFDDPRLGCSRTSMRLLRIVFCDKDGQFIAQGRINLSSESDIGVLVAQQGGEVAKLFLQPGEGTTLKPYRRIDDIPTGALAEIVEKDFTSGDKVSKEEVVAYIANLVKEMERVTHPMLAPMMHTACSDLERASRIIENQRDYFRGFMPHMKMW